MLKWRRESVLDAYNLLLALFEFCWRIGLCAARFFGCIDRT